MESSHRFQEYQIPSPNSSSNSSSNSTTSNGLNHQSHNYYRHPSPRTPTAPISLPITRSEPNSPYPTTFVQADSSTFKQVVQMLTGSSETAKLASGSGRQETTAPVKNFPIPPIKPGMMRKDKSTSKLYERRNSLKNFKLSPLPSGLVNNKPVFSGSPRPEILSPSLLDFPSLALSPVTPLIPDPFNRSPPNASLNMEAEEKAIARKGFYLHPSPSTTPRESETPRLLPLFPVTSPKVAGSADC